MGTGNVQQLASAKVVPSASNNQFYLLNEPTTFKFADKVRTDYLLKRQEQPPISKGRKPIVFPDKDTVAAAYRGGKKGEVTHVGVFRKNVSAHIIQMLGNIEVLSHGEFTFNNQSYILDLVGNADYAESAFNAFDDSQDVVPQAGIVFANDKNGNVRFVCPSDGRVQYSKLPKAQKLKFAAAAMARMASLNNKGFMLSRGSPGSFVFDGTYAKVKDPTELHAMNEQDSILHQMAAMLAMFNRHGDIGGMEMKKLVKLYLAMSVVGRAGIMDELKAKGSKLQPHETLVYLAMKYSGLL